MIPAYDDDDDGHDGGNENENEAYDETAAGRQQRQVAVVDMDGKINSTAATSSSSSNVLESRQPVGDILIARPRTQVAPQLRLARDASRKVLPLRLTPPQETKTSTPALPLNPTPTTVDAAATLRRRARSDGRSEESRLQKKDHLLADFHSHSSTRSDSLQDQLAGESTSYLLFHYLYLSPRSSLASTSTAIGAHTGVRGIHEDLTWPPNALIFDTDTRTSGSERKVTQVTW